MRIISAGTVAVRPGTLMDRQTAVAVTRMHRAMRGRLALPVDDVSCRQIRPPHERAPAETHLLPPTSSPLELGPVITALHKNVIASALYYSAALLTPTCALKR